MSNLSAETQDIGMIDREIIEDLKKINEEQQKYEKLNDLVIEAFTQGIASKTHTDGEDTTKAPEDHFQEDKFKYQKWQLEICKYIHDQNEEKSFSQVKNSILREGLNKISNDL